MNLSKFESTTSPQDHVATQLSDKIRCYHSTCSQLPGRDEESSTSPSSTCTMAAPAQFLKFVDDNADKFVKRLGEAVAIPRQA